MTTEIISISDYLKKDKKVNEEDQKVHEGEFISNTENIPNEEPNASTSTNKDEYYSFFDSAERGVFYHQFLGTSKESGEPMWNVIAICTRVDIVAYIRDEDGGSWGRVLKIYDKEGNDHEWIILMEWLSRDGDEVRKGLLHYGAEIITPSRSIYNLLNRYLLEAEVNAKAILLERLGWYKGRFVLSDRIISKKTVVEEKVYFKNDRDKTNRFTQAGTLESWQENVSKYCVGNSRLIFAVCTAFAAPLVRLLKTKSVGFHFVGNSTIGKTTALRVAASVCGGKEYMHQWKGTDNGLEGVASYHNDTLLALDEINEVKEDAISKIVYMFANGQGKIRATKSGLPRPPTQWELIWLSTGETGTETLASKYEKIPKAGLLSRQIDLPADAGKNMGIFENIHNLNNGKEFSNLITHNALNHHGTAFTKWIEHLVESISDEYIEEIRNAHKTIENALLAKYPEAEGQVQRVSGSFALVAIAGMYATKVGITLWPEMEAYDAIEKMFDAWVDNREHTGNMEGSVALEQIKYFWEQHVNGNKLTVLDRSKNIEDRNRSHQGQVGYLYNHDGRYEVFVPTETYKKVIVPLSGLTRKTVTSMLLEKGWLKQGKYDFKHNTFWPYTTIALPQPKPSLEDDVARLHGSPLKRLYSYQNVYVFDLNKILGDGIETEAKI